ncbi:hypothetical protein ACFXKF_14795 [Streptomyces scopuliridis]|uniref:hypothetical protein n=2 Tax=Streptomyces scopuliridis TaxID=452529 RepID=UPI0036A9746C
MMRVLISPSYGSSGTRRHWSDTVDQEIPFTERRYDEVLAPQQREQLTALHPEERARFWGATASHDKKMADVATGDIVLFTGQNQVRAVGEVGAVFRNRSLADLLWPPKHGEKSWHTVYSLLDVVPADIPYSQLNATIGYKPAHNFPGQMVLRDDKARSVLEEFMITPGTEWSRAADGPPESRDASPRQAVRVAATEEMRTRTASYERTRRLVVVERLESELVSEFKLHLAAQGRIPTRFYCPSGISDIYVENAGDAELIEAKSKPTHHHIRQALGQLLDYAPHSPQPIQRLAGLFPSSPTRADAGLLHRYGIDVIHRESPGIFHRLPASHGTRELMRRIWSA